jgi:serine/threonine protein kinase
LGKGGSGAVYLATQQPSGKPVAIKVLLAQVAVSEKARNNFLREIEVTKKLRHPNVITLLDHGAIGSTFYFVMEYCRPGSLGELVWRGGGKLSEREALPLLLDSLEGLAYCHEQDMVHRDLKPDNILLAETPAGRVLAKISDLGLAKNFATAGLSGMTVTGHFAGTYEYMPREQLTRFKFVSPASDVWSLGATFYHALTGCFPHDFPPGKDPAKVVLEADVVPIRSRDASLSKELAAVIDRSLAIQPAKRYQDARAMKRALASVLWEPKEHG